MIQIILGLILLGTFACFCRFSSFVRTKQPPGPTPFPFVGNLLQIGRRPHLKFTQWAKAYGPIVQFKLGLQNAIVITDPKIAKEILNDYSSTGRLTTNPVTAEFGQGEGLINVEGPTWEAQRQFAVGILRKYGFGHLPVERNILFEAQTMVTWLQNMEGKVIDAYRMFQAPVVNATWKIVAGKRFEWENGEKLVLDSATNFLQALMNVSTSGLMLAPVLRFVAPKYFGWTEYHKCAHDFSEHLAKAVEQHKENFEKDNLRDFIDEYIHKINGCKDKNSSFYKETGYANLKAIIFDLFVGGTETTSGLLSWILLYLSEHQDVQRKLELEIDQVMNKQLPSMNHRKNMPYTQAVIMESLRLSSVAALGLPHRILEDRIFNDYYFTKGTTMFVNIYGMDHSSLFWKDPERFYPERFLNENETKFIYHNDFIPFGDGKRKCIGEGLSRATAFLFVTSIFQKYSIQRDPELKKRKADLEAEIGFSLFPKPYKLQILRRKVKVQRRKSLRRLNSGG